MIGIKNIVFYVIVIAFLRHHAEASQEQFTSNPGQTTDKKELGLTKDNPAFLCRDIKIQNQEAQSGKYWINPLIENPKYQPIEAWCNFPSGETCIYAEPMYKDPIEMSSTSGEIWMHTIGMKISYRIHPRQLKKLQEISDSCIQSVKIHCKNVVAYYDDAEDSMENGVKLFSSDGLQLTMEGPRLLRFRAREDGCKIRTGEWAETLLFYRTTHCRRLPIEDIAIRDNGKPDQWVQMDVQVACFSQGDGWHL